MTMYIKPSGVKVDVNDEQKATKDYLKKMKWIRLDRYEKAMTDKMEKAAIQGDDALLDNPVK